MRLLLGVIFVVSAFVCCYCVIMALASWFDVSRRSRRLTEEFPVSPGEARHFDELLWMTVVMNMTAVVAGALAGIGASLAVKDGVVRWPTGNGMQYLYIGVFGVEIVGLLGIVRLRRPWHRWIADAGALQEFLRQGAFRPDLRPDELALAEKRLRELAAKHFGGRRHRLLRATRLHRPHAAREWRSSASSVNDADSIRRSFNRLEVLRYAAVSGYSGTYLMAAVLASLAVVAWALIAPTDTWQHLLRAVELIGGLALGWLVTLLPARAALALETRVMARERVWLAGCRRRLTALTTIRTQERPIEKTILQVGSWALVRRV